MKKLALLFSVITLVFMSCSSDDNETETDPIIGIWKFSGSFINGEPAESEPCDSETTYVFSSNGEYSETHYEESEGNCQLDGFYEGTWLNTDDIYYITIEGDTESREFIFEGNTFYNEYSLMSTGPDPTLETYKYVYVKL